ncbi:MAG: DUF4186 domain-containing protein [Thermoguttaceae bacterium]|nr:DUF4186 domain-containing protein [Thermoguttaceae bacterium]
MNRSSEKSSTLVSPPCWDPDQQLRWLSESRFRSRQHLGIAERKILQRLGLEKVLEHGRVFLTQRVAPARPANDGRQTPMRKHPIFVAQHATATCCRGCIARWYNIPTGRELTALEIDTLLTVIRHWLEREMERSDCKKAEPSPTAAKRRPRSVQQTLFQTDCETAKKHEG